MYDKEDKQWLYGKFVDAGLNIGTYEDFDHSLQNDEDKKWYHEKATSLGLNVGEYDEFDKAFGQKPRQSKPSNKEYPINDIRNPKNIMHQPDEFTPPDGMDWETNPVPATEQKPARRPRIVDYILGNANSPSEKIAEQEQPELRYKSDASGDLPQALKDAGLTAQDVKFQWGGGQSGAGYYTLTPEQAKQVEENKKQVDRYVQMFSPESVIAPDNVGQEQKESVKSFVGGLMQSTKAAGGSIMNAIGESIRSMRIAKFGWKADDLLWKEAQEEFARREKEQEPLFQRNQGPISAERFSKSKSERRSEERKDEVNRLINYLEQKAIAEGKDPAEEVRGKLNNPNNRDEVTFLTGKGSEIIDNNSAPLEGAAKLGALVPMAATTAASIGLSAAGYPTAAKGFADATLAAFAASSAGSAMKQARDSGATNEQTLAAGLASGAIMYGFAKVPIGRYINQAAADTAAKHVTGIVSKDAGRELQLLLTDAASRGYLTKETASILAKQWLGNIGTSTASFAAMSGAEAIVPLIYEDPDKYPVLSNVLKATISGAEDGLIMGTIMGGISSGAMVAGRTRRWQEQGDVYLAEVQSSGNDVHAVWDQKTKTWEPLLASDAPSKMSFAEILGYNRDEKTGGITGDLIMIQAEDGNIYLADPSIVKIARKFSAKKAETEAKKAYRDSGYDAGEAAQTPEQKTDIRVDNEYQTRKAEKEAAQGGVSEGTQLDVDRANAAMEGRRNAMRTKMEQRIGKPFWTGANGSETVDVATLADGREVFVTAEDDKGIAFVDMDGNNGMTDKANIASRNQSGLNDYLDGKVSEEDTAVEQERMATEQADNVMALIEKVQQDGKVNLSAEENPVWGTVVNINPAADGGVTVQVEGEANPRFLNWKQVASTINMPFEPKSNEDLVADRLKVDEEVDNYNNNIPVDSDLMVQLEGGDVVAYKFKDAEQVDGDIILHAEDTETGEVVDIFPEMVTNLDALMRGENGKNSASGINAVNELQGLVVPNATNMSDEYIGLGKVEQEGPNTHFFLKGDPANAKRTRLTIRHIADRAQTYEEFIDGLRARGWYITSTQAQASGWVKERFEAYKRGEMSLDQFADYFVPEEYRETTKTSAPAPAAEEAAPVFTDPVANELGIDKKYAHTTPSGEVVVDGRVLWNENPELWAEWNDRNPNRGISTKEYLEDKQQKAAQEAQTALDAYKAEWKGNQDPDVLQTLKAEMDKKTDRLQRINDLVKKYDDAEKAAQLAKEQPAPVEEARPAEPAAPATAVAENPTPEITPIQQEALNTIGTTPEQAAMDVAQAKLDDIAKRNTPDLPRTRKVELMREKAGVLQEMMDRTGAENTVVSTREDILGLYKRDGAAEEYLQELERTLEETSKTGERVRGFFDKDTGKVYMIADDIRSVMDADTTYSHEDKHRSNREDGAHFESLGTGVTRQELVTAVQNLTGTHRYDGNSNAGLADEVLANAAEIAKKQGVEAIPGELRKAGIKNEEFINFVQNNIKNGRRRSNNRSLDERGSALQHRNEEVRGGQDGRNQQQGSGALEGQRPGTAGGSAPSVRAGAEVESPAAEAISDRVGDNATPEEIRLNDAGVASNQDEGRFSVRYAPAEDEANQIAADVAKDANVPVKKAKEWVKSETSLAAIILDEHNSPYLNYIADDRYTAIKSDSDYPQGTVDFNNICRKRHTFTDMYQRIQKAFPNTIITGADLATIRQIMKEHGETVACGLCYVEDRRQLLGEIARNFIQELNGNFENYAKGGETKQKNAEKFRELLGDDRKDDLSIYDLLTLDGSQALYNEHPGIYNAFQAFNKARGQQSGNLFQGYAEYKREILKWTPAKVASVNGNGGLRVFSYSDFEAHHLIDLVQIIQDCARKGVMIQGYTKVPAFARAVANTGIKLNRSLIPLGDTGIVDGKLAYDPVEGIDINDPDFLESNDNVGNILIGINDEQIALAMLDPFVHYIIPYHSNQSGILRQMKQTGAWTNYKNEQLEKGGKEVNIYKDVLAAAEAEGKPIKNERQFVNKFLQVCRERGLTPRFSRFLNVDNNGNFAYRKGYYKLLLDFKLFDEDGKILPQKPVVAKFDDDFNAQILRDYVADERAKDGGIQDDLYNEIVEKLGLDDRAPDIHFSITNRKNDIFVSNAEKAVAGIKMEKATPEQWLKMIEKGGGLKAGEDKWIGLSDWLKSSDRKSLTKQEVSDFIEQNRIRVEEVNYSENGLMSDEELDDVINELPPALDSFHTRLQNEFDDLLGEMSAEEAYDTMAEKYGAKFEEAYDRDEVIDGESLDWSYIDPLMELAGIKNEGEYNNDRAINATRLTYTTEGLENKREIALTVPTIEPWNEGDRIHFGDAGEGRAIAWIRFGDAAVSNAKNAAEAEYIAADKAWRDYRDEIISKYALQATGTKTTKDLATPEENARTKELMLDSLAKKDAWQKGDYPKERVLVIDEIQSKRHQEGRDQGYVDESPIKEKERRVAEAKERYEKANKDVSEYVDSLRDPINPSDEETLRLIELKTRRDRLFAELRDAQDQRIDGNSIKGVPAAPFEKNWHELAMKRMLRLAAEEGYDYVAWTTGEQQAERYNIGNAVESISATKFGHVYGFSEDTKQVVINFRDGGLSSTLRVNREGKIVAAGGDDIYLDKKLSEVVGKEIAVRLLGDDSASIKGDGLRIGGEGMKGFYDDILPRFMNKYGKKWGTKVEDLFIPDIGEDAAAGAANGLTMHAVPVTEEMKESVMGGQPMFSIHGREVRYPESVTQEQRDEIEKTLTDYTNQEKHHKALDVIAGVNEEIKGKYDAERLRVEQENLAEAKSIKDRLSILGRKRGELYAKDPKSAEFKAVVAEIGELRKRAKELSDKLPSLNLHTQENKELRDNAIASLFDNTKWRSVAVVPTHIPAVDEVLREKGWNGQSNMALATERGYMGHQAGHHANMTAAENSADMLQNLYEPDTAGFEKGHEDTLLFIRKDPNGFWYTTGVAVDKEHKGDGSLMFVTTYKDKEDPRNRLVRILDLGYPSGTVASSRVSWDFDNHGANIGINSESAIDSAKNLHDDASETGGATFSIVADPAKIDELESGNKVKVYRSMQVIDGKLYPPMSAMVDGEMRNPSELGVWEQADENPDLADDDGNFKLDKGNGKSLKAAYAPYFHTRRSPLNEQFSEAYNRPNLVIVESEIPESELTSGYTADRSKKSTGEHDWPSGKISNALANQGDDTRKVILSRWAKPIRIVPNSEVADIIAKKIEGKNLSFPYNVVTPGLREELRKRGVRFDGWQGNKPKNVDEIIAGMQRSDNVIDYLFNGAESIAPAEQPKFSVTAQENEDYMNAVNSGDMEKAQELVDRAAEQAGYTIRGYHGTTHNFFVFDRSNGNAEGNWGKGFYFTNSYDDASANYGDENGPDLVNRIERLAENMEWMDGYEDMDYDARLEEARKMLTGDNPHVISAAIRMENPLIIDSHMNSNETFFDFDSGYNPETDEYEGEESGRLLDFVDAWNEEMDSYEWDGYNVSPNEILEYGYDGLTASQLETKAREILDNAGIMNQEGELASGEFLRAVFERMGFDGIIDNNVNFKFGTQRKYGRGMDGMDTGTTHIIAFHPNQMKQTDPVTYDDNGNVIPLSERFNEMSNDIRFSLRGIIGAQNDADAMANLDVAEEMEKAGKDAKTIWAATGWEKGVDGKWRNEIKDATPKELAKNKRTFKVGDIIDAPELFASYPEMKDYKVVFKKMKGVAGQFTRENKTLTLDPSDCTGYDVSAEQQGKIVDATRDYIRSGQASSRKDAESYMKKLYEENGKRVLAGEGIAVVLHELQHAIQAVEGFARGGNTSNERIQIFRKAIEDNPITGSFALYYSTANDPSKLVRVGKNAIVSSIDRFISQFGERDQELLKNLSDYLSSCTDEEYNKLVREGYQIATDAKKNAPKNYHNLAGEVEARNVMSRHGMTEEDRAAIPPSETESVPRDEQGIRFSVTRQDTIQSFEENGLGGVIGEENVEPLMRSVYAAIPKSVKAPIVDKAMRELDFRKPLNDYLHELTAKGTENDETGLLRALYDDIRVLTGNLALTDNDIRYMIWKSSGESNGDILSMAADIAVRNRWNVGKDEPRFSVRKQDLTDVVENAQEQLDETVSGAEEKRKVVKEAVPLMKDLLNPIVTAMAAQKDYDRATVDGIVDFAKQVMKNGGVSTLTTREFNRLLTIIKSSAGKSPKSVTKYSTELLDKLLDHMVKDELAKFEKLVNIKDVKTNQSGVATVGSLDVSGQISMRAMRDYMLRPQEEIDTRIAEVENKFDSEDKKTREDARAKYEGLKLASDYQRDLAENIKEGNDLENELDEAKDAKRSGDFPAKDYAEFAKVTEQAIRENKIARVDFYRDFINRLAELQKGSKVRAHAFREAEKDRVERIHHLANLDMQGTPNKEHLEPDWKSRALNSTGIRFFLKPLATFDQMLRLFGRSTVTGEGYLYNHFGRGWIDAREKELVGKEEAMAELDTEVQDVFDDPDMKWSKLYDKERKMPGATVYFFDGGEKVAHDLTPGNLLYIYMANKMIDGKMKLRKMGISEDDVTKIKESLDPKFIELADWLQEEFLPKRRAKYNAVHEEMFGAPMAAIDDYFPLKILSNARVENIDLADDPNASGLSSTTTGSIVKRQKNSLALDLLNTDAFSLAVEHIEEMENWAAFAKLRRDMNTLLSYKRFRNQVQNMDTVYGSGKVLWDNFRDVASIAMGNYKPKVGKQDIDTLALNVAKGVTGAKIAFRIGTALKQVLSAPAFLSDARIDILAKNLATAPLAWNWCAENLPIFRERWNSRFAGDTRLMKTESDWKLWKNKLVQKAGMLGMSPNAFVDALTVAVGAKSMYDTNYKRYVDGGYSEEEADRKAKQDATILYNQTQQSSEAMFTSAMQLDRTLGSVLFTVFRNSSMGYTRQTHDAFRIYGRMSRDGYKERAIERMTRQRMEDGLNEDQAKAFAEKEYNRQYWRSAARIGIFAFLLPLAWNYGVGDLLYLLFGDDDKEKEKIHHDALMHTIAGPVEGLTAGSVISSAWGTFSSTGKTGDIGLAELPIESDLDKILSMRDYDAPAAVAEIINLIVQSGIGVNPQTFTDAIVATIDAFEGDMGTAKEFAIWLMRVNQLPQPSIERFLVDEFEMTPDEAKAARLEDLAKRYADYKLRKGAPMNWWMYNPEIEAKRRKSYETKFKKKVKEREKLHVDEQETN